MIDTSRSMLFHIGNLNTESQRISYQMGTGKSLQHGSDDSLLHANIIQIEDKLRVTENLKLQIVKSQAANNVSDSSFAEMKLLLDDIKVDLMRGLDPGMDRETKIALKTNLEGIRENMFDLANARVDGEYVFSGSVTTKETFVKDPDYENNGKITYNGDGFLRKIAVQPGSYRDRGVTGYELGFYNASTAIANQVPNEVLTVSANERIIDSEGYEWKLAKDPYGDGTNYIQRYDHNGDIFHPPVQLEASAVTPAVEADATQQATQESFTVSIGSVTDSTRVPHDEINIEHLKFESKHSYFEDLNIIINALEGNSTLLDGTKGPTINNSLVDDTLRTGLDQSSKQFDATNVGHGELGGRNKIFNVAYDKLESQVTHYNILLTEVDGADMAKLAMESKALEMTYSGLYSTIMKMNELSLVNFMK